MFIHNGGEEEQKGVKSNPTRGRNQRSKAGIYSEGLVPLWIKENLTPLQPVCFCLVYRLNVCASCVLQQINWKVFLSYVQHGRTSHLLHERWHFSFLISSFIPLFIFLPHISPRLPSSHPNQRTHRPLLGTPCPGKRPCIARYLEKTRSVDEHVRYSQKRQHQDVNYVD